MRTLVALCLGVVMRALQAQTPLRTFSSPDGTFQFKYSHALVHCRAGETEKGFAAPWAPAEECTSQDGVCDDAPSAARTIVCLAYPKEEFRGKPSFNAGAFFVAEVTEATTEKTCLEGSSNWLINASGSTRIGDVRFKTFRISDAWTSGGQDGDIYRAYRSNRCYELGIQEAYSSTGGLDPGTFQEFTKQDERRVRFRLNQALQTFRFLK